MDITLLGKPQSVESHTHKFYLVCLVWHHSSPITPRICCCSTGIYRLNLPILIFYHSSLNHQIVCFNSSPFCTFVNVPKERIPTSFAKPEYVFATELSSTVKCYLLIVLYIFMLFNEEIKLFFILKPCALNPPYQLTC